MTSAPALHIPAGLGTNAPGELSWLSDRKGVCVWRGLVPRWEAGRTRTLHTDKSAPVNRTSRTRRLLVRTASLEVGGFVVVSRKLSCLKTWLKGVVFRFFRRTTQHRFSGPNGPGRNPPSPFTWCHSTWPRSPHASGLFNAQVARPRLGLALRRELGCHEIAWYACGVRAGLLPLT